MANKFFESVSTKFSNFFSFVWGILQALWLILLGLGKGIIIAVALLAMTVLVYNPLMFFIWSIVSPKSVASGLNDMDIPVYTDFVKAVNGWMVHCYPYFMKKYFMELGNFSEYSVSSQLRYYRENPTVEVLRKLSSEALYKLWSVSENNADRETIVKIVDSGCSLNREQIMCLQKHGLNELLVDYFLKNTPSVDIVRVMMKENREVFLFIVEKYGLSSQLLREMYENSTVELISEAEKKLESYSHRRIALECASATRGHEFWKIFCNETENISISAQKVMQPWQYVDYYSTDHKLSETALEYLFANDAYCKLWSMIFEHEPKNGIANAKIKSLVAANPRLKMMYLEFKAGKK